MSSSTALLPKDRKKDDHPIFLRTCHSPWIGIGQNSLVFLRGLVAVYLLVSFLMIIDYDVDVNKHGWLAAFEFANISYLLQLIYHWATFTWTFMHLHYPHHSSQAPSCTTRFQKFLSPPRQHCHNRTVFSIFYTCVVTFPLLVTLIYWAILRPMQKTTIPGSELFGRGWFTEFFVFNKFAVNSLIALIEVLVFSSIKRQTPLWAHIFGLMFVCLAYVAWAFTGYMIFDKYPYFFFDRRDVGWEHVVCAIVAFVALANIFFSFVYGLTGLRELYTKKGEDKSYGYSRLPH